MSGHLNSPVGHEGILLAPEHDADIGGMIDGGVEVRVVSNLGWKVHCGLTLRHKGSDKGRE